MNGVQRHERTGGQSSPFSRLDRMSGEWMRALPMTRGQGAPCEMRCEDVISPDAVTATYEDGILEVRVPGAETAARGGADDDRHQQGLTRPPGRPRRGPAMTTGTFELRELTPTAAAVVRGRVAPAQLLGLLAAAFADVARLLADHHRSPAGPSSAQDAPTSDGFEVEAGFPADGRIEPAGRVTPTLLPGGSAMTAVHHGPYDTVGETYAALTGWLTAHDRRAAGAAWESYLDGADVPEPRTSVILPCAPG